MFAWWPWVNKLRLEALEDKYEALLKVEHKRYEDLDLLYAELKLKADELLEQVLTDFAKERQEALTAPETEPPPRTRPLRKDIIAQANAAMASKFRLKQETARTKAT